MSIGKQNLLVAGALWLLLLAVALVARPILPIDETRYLSVAWEMWQRGDFLVPHLNGAAYSHKPPFLFWLIDAGWWLFGVNELSARLVSPLFGLANLALTAAVARRLWPEHTGIASVASIVVVGSMLWSVFTTLVMFDMPLTFFVLLGILGVLRTFHQKGTAGWILLAMSIGMGALVKGPVILLHILPVILAAPLWIVERPAIGWWWWYGATASSLLVGAAIAFMWALPAAVEGGSQYGHAILLGQTTGRVARAFAHRRPVWWYIPLLPALLFPWALWPPIWRALAAMRREKSDAGTRFCIVWMAASFLGFSIISGKQIHYLLPLLPGVALLIARALGGSPAVVRRRDSVLPALVVFCIGVTLLAGGSLAFLDKARAWISLISPIVGLVLCLGAVALVLIPIRTTRQGVIRMACAVTFAVVVLQLGAKEQMTLAYDVEAVARHLGTLERSGSRIAHVGKYHGQYHFLGRLQRPLTVLDKTDSGRWRGAHPRGAVVSYSRIRIPPTNTESISYSQPHLSGRIIVTQGR